MRKISSLCTFVGGIVVGFGLMSLPHSVAEEKGGGGAVRGSCPADIAPPGGDGVVNVSDLLAVINGWGPCIPPGGCSTHNDCATIFPNAAGICVAGQCVMGACNVGFADCNGLAADGCEVNITTDVYNCGGCNMPCNLPNATAICVNGVCMIGSCNVGYADCNGLVFDGCEAPWPCP